MRFQRRIDTPAKTRDTRDHDFNFQNPVYPVHPC